MQERSCHCCRKWRKAHSWAHSCNWSLWEVASQFFLARYVTSLTIFLFLYPFSFFYFNFLTWVTMTHLSLSHTSHYDSLPWATMTPTYDSYRLIMTHYETCTIFIFIDCFTFVDCPRVRWSTNLILQYYKYGQSRALQPQTWLLVSYGTESQ